MSKKNIFFFLFFPFLLAHQAICQSFSAEKKIAKADSLFQKADYSKAEKLYQEVFYQEKKYSTSMLLKLASIANKKQDYVAYLYWLNLYFQSNPSLKIAEKISNTALAYEISGYQLSDRRWLTILYHRYYKFIALGFSVLGIFLVLLLFIRKQPLFIFRRNSVLLMIMLIFSLIFLNIAPDTKEVVIKQEHAYLMSAPSGASLVMGKAKKGQKLQVNSQKDVWIEVVWNNQKVFVKESQVYFGFVF